MLFHKKNELIPLLDTLNCGKLLELMNADDYNQNMTIVVGQDMETIAHYHIGNDEIYICLEGEFHVQTLSPEENIVHSHILKPYEWLNIPKNTHHKILKSDKPNKLLAICLPAWREEWEVASDLL